MSPAGVDTGLSGGETRKQKGPHRDYSHRPSALQEPVCTRRKPPGALGQCESRDMGQDPPTHRDGLAKGLLPGQKLSTASD